MSRIGPPASAVAAGLLFGGLAGLAEVGWLGLRRVAAGELVFVAEFFWLLAPAANGILIAAISALAVLLSPRRWRARLAVMVPVGLATLAVLLVPGRLHVAAALLVAAGIGLRAGSWLAGRAPRTPAPWAGAIGVVLVALPLLAWLVLRAAPDGRSALMSAPEGAPNVLLIVLDTVRAIELSLHDPRLGTTPAIDSLAAGGVVFEQANSTAPWTLPSHGSLFTGLWAHELAADYDRAMADSHPTVAEILSAHGYRTAGFTANHEYTTRETGVARGFSHYEDRVLTFAESTRLTALTRFVSDGVRRVIGSADPIPNRILAHQITGRALDWLGSGRDRQPYFVFLNYYEGHAPYQAPDSLWHRYVPETVSPPVDIPVQERWEPDSVRVRQQAYRASIAHLDRELRRLFEQLGQRGLLDNTLLIVTSDHGEEFYAHDVMGHGNSLHRPGVHVPLVVRWPDGVPGGVRVGDPVTLRDIPATILDLAGIFGALPGATLRRYWEVADTSEAAPRSGEIVYTQVTRSRNLPTRYPVMDSDIASAQQGSARLIVQDREEGTTQLFDHAADPMERTDLSRSADYRWLHRLLLDSLVASGALKDPAWRGAGAGGR